MKLSASIKNINWVDESQSLKTSIITFQNLLIRYNKKINDIINTHTIASIIIIEFFNQCLTKNQIYYGQLKMIIKNLQLKHTIETFLNFTSIIYLDNKSVSFEQNNGRKYMLDSMLTIDMLLHIGNLPKYKLAKTLANNILKIINELPNENIINYKETSFTL